MSDTTSRRRPRALLPIVLLAVLALGPLGAAAWKAGVLGGRASFHGTAYEPPQDAAGFRLTDQAGRAVSLDDYRGKAVLVFFGYTHCPDVCPLTLTRLSRVLRGMRADSTEVRVLLVTVDPERDTPPVLADYVARFGPWVSGLTGDSAALAEMRRGYAVYAQPMPAGGGHPQMGHSSQVFGIDRAGRLRVLLPTEQPDAVVAEDIRTLMRL